MDKKSELLLVATKSQLFPQIMFEGSLRPPNQICKIQERTCPAAPVLHDETPKGLASVGRLAGIRPEDVRSVWLGECGMAYVGVVRSVLWYGMRRHAAALPHHDPSLLRGERISFPSLYLVSTRGGRV